jgi:hypothetical protein
MTTARRRVTAPVAVSALGLAGAVGAVAVALAAAPAAVAAPSPAPSAALPAGLHGTADPAYDGVWRQSLTLLAQDSAGVKPAAAAVSWLTGQQCGNGAFPSYRAATGTPCAAKLPLDTNATAAAVQALSALGGQRATAVKALDWLKSVQNADGGWGYNPGGASDANSTAMVIGALTAAGERPGEVRSPGGKSPLDALMTFARPCGGKDGGAFVYQPQQPGIVADSTAAAVVGALGQGLVVPAGAKAEGAAECRDAAGSPETASRNGAVYLAGALAATGQLNAPPMPGSEDTSVKPDTGNTADAVVALAAQGMTEQARKPLEWLRANGPAWAKESGPAAYAQLVLAAGAAGADPRDFGGTDLVAALNATGPAPEKAPSPTGEQEKKDTKETKDAKDAKDAKNDDSPNIWWIIGAFFAASVGAGILFSGRRNKK